MNKTIQPVFIFERVRLGYKTTTPDGSRYGTYLYRDITNNTLIASWDKPTKGKKHLYSGGDIGYNTDALIYYKNI
jgi:hypothetical protein